MHNAHTHTQNRYREKTFPCCSTDSILANSVHWPVSKRNFDIKFNWSVLCNERFYQSKHYVCIHVDFDEVMHEIHETATCILIIHVMNNVNDTIFKFTQVYTCVGWNGWTNWIYWLFNKLRAEINTYIKENHGKVWNRNCNSSNIEEDSDSEWFKQITSDERFFRIFIEIVANCQFPYRKSNIHVHQMNDSSCEFAAKLLKYVDQIRMKTTLNPSEKGKNGSNSLNWVKHCLHRTIQSTMQHFFSRKTRLLLLNSSFIPYNLRLTL